MRRGTTSKAVRATAPKLRRAMRISRRTSARPFTNSAIRKKLPRPRRMSIPLIRTCQRVPAPLSYPLLITRDRVGRNLDLAKWSGPVICKGPRKGSSNTTRRAARLTRGLSLGDKRRRRGLAAGNRWAHQQAPLARQSAFPSNPPRRSVWPRKPRRSSLSPPHRPPRNSRPRWKCRQCRPRRYSPRNASKSTSRNSGPHSRRLLFTEDNPWLFCTISGPGRPPAIHPPIPR